MTEPDIPIQDLLDPPELLTEYAGTFWTRMVKDPEFVAGYLRGCGHLYSQLAIDAQTTQDIADREKVPEYQRLLFMPVILNDAERNTGDALRLRVRRDNPIKLGSQPEGGPYTAGTVYQLGGYVSLDGVTAYPAHTPVNTILALTAATESSKKVLIRGSDFIFQDNTLLFLGGYDPLQDPELRVENGQLVLVGAEVEVDSPLVSEHIGYALGIWNTGDPGLKPYMNRVWDSYTRGLSRGLLGRAVGALLGTPTTQKRETAEAITDNAVVTDTNVYPVTDPGFNVGAVLDAGTSLDHAFTIFEREEDLARMRELLPTLVLGAGLLPPEIENGLAFGWEEQVWDESGGHMLFDVIGRDKDVEAFWDQARITATMVESTRVVPGEFVYRNLLKDHLIIVYIDTSKVSETALRRLRYLDRLLEARDRRTMIMVILRFDADSQLSEEYSDSSDMVDADALEERSGVGGSESNLQYRDSLSWRFIPACEVIHADEE